VQLRCLLVIQNCSGSGTLRTWSVCTWQMVASTTAKIYRCTLLKRIHAVHISIIFLLCINVKSNVMPWQPWSKCVASIYKIMICMFCGCLPPYTCIRYLQICISYSPKLKAGSFEGLQPHRWGFWSSQCREGRSTFCALAASHVALPKYRTHTPCIVSAAQAGARVPSSWESGVLWQPVGGGLS
jgi:hypothetical protein